MNRTILAMASYSGVPCRETRNSLSLVAPRLRAELPSCSDIALARSRLFTQVLGIADSHPDVDTILCVDDDIMFAPGDAQRLVSMSRQYGRPVSGVYGALTGQLCATKSDDFEPHEGRPTYRTGMGFIAIPLILMRHLSGILGSVSGPMGRIVPFCTSGPGRNGAWESEDYSLSSRLGGVILAPIAVGHVKQVPIWPDAETMRRITEGSALEPDPNKGDGSPVPLQDARIALKGIT